MLRSYIFNKNNEEWIEGDHKLLLHDICAILDEEKKTIFLWKGPKGSKETFSKALSSLNRLRKNYEEFDLIISRKKKPNYIEKKIHSLLSSEQIEQKTENYEFSRFITIRTFFMLLIISIILFSFSLGNLWNAINWTSLNENFVITATEYNHWLDVSSYSLVSLIILLIILFLIGIYEKDPNAIILSLIGLIISISIFFYLQQGIFLFIFQSGSDFSMYIIKKMDIVIFLSILSISFTIYILPAIIVSIYFLKTYKQFFFP